MSTNETDVREGRGEAVGGECWLKDFVKLRCGSVAKLANEVGWSDAKTRRVVYGEQEPTPTEMRQLAEALGLKSAEEIAAVFHL